MAKTNKYKVEGILPEREQGDPKKDQVARMFDSISGQYDFLNHLLSFGIDYYWRFVVVSVLRKFGAKKVLDVATGTGDLALAAYQQGGAEEVVGVDIARQMLSIGQQKIARKQLHPAVRLEYGDAEELKFPDHTFDAVTVAFGVRNFGDLEKGLSEIARVLKPGGLALILEFSQPRRTPIKQVYKFYSYQILPSVGKLFSKSESAYQYLPESVSVFPSGKAFTDIMKKAGFRQTKDHSLTFGICSIYAGKK